MKIAIIDDFALMRDLVRSVCTSVPAWEIVAEASNGKDGIEASLRTKPQIVVLDLELPLFSGFEVIEFARRAIPDVRILILSAYCDRYTVYRVERAAVHGFICKTDGTVGLLREAIESIMIGGNYFSPSFEHERRRRRRDSTAFDKILTEREMKVLTLVASSCTDQQISERLKMSLATVIKHRFNVAHKVGSHGRIELEQFARANGFQDFISSQQFGP